MSFAEVTSPGIETSLHTQLLCNNCACVLQCLRSARHGPNHAPWSGERSTTFEPRLICVWPVWAGNITLISMVIVDWSATAGIL